MCKKGTFIAITALIIAAADCAATAHADATRGTKETITFEGICGKKKQKDIKDGYDGFNWPGMFVTGREVDQSDAGFQSVVRGKAAAHPEKSGDGFEATISSADASFFSLVGGHFAAFANASSEVTFSAYRKGVLVGTKQMTLDPVNTHIQFDDTFKNIDTLVIDATGDGDGVAMDNLVVRF